jgi:hypothetical protein
VLRFPSLIILFASLSMAATPESAAFCTLTLEPHPALTDAPEALQKKFLAVAREKSGYNLALRSEVDAALAKANATDLSSDAQLAKVAPGCAKQEKIVHVADIPAGPHDLCHEMVERVEHHVGEELAREIADRQTRTASETTRLARRGDLSA